VPRTASAPDEKESAGVTETADVAAPATPGPPHGEKPPLGSDSDHADELTSAGAVAGTEPPTARSTPGPQKVLELPAPTVALEDNKLADAPEPPEAATASATAFTAAKRAFLRAALGTPPVGT
jgi:hypothetical protein